MVRLQLAHVSLLPLFVACAADGDVSSTREMLDSIARMVDGSLPGVSDSFFDSLSTCMGTSTNLTASHDAAWTGFRQFFITNGTAGDGWGACSAEAGCKQYMENNYTALDVDAIGIFEPCNSVSNLAYYKTALGICNHEGWAMREDSQGALKQAYVHLAMGSFFWHGSHSFLGNVADNRLIDVLSFVSYQVSIEAFLPMSNATAFNILRDLQTIPRSASAVESTQALTQMFLEQPVDDWQAGIDALDMPDYYLTFAALVGNVLNVLLPSETVDTIIDALATAFGLPEEYLTFMDQQYLPALRSATEAQGIVLTSVEKASLGLKFTGTLFKVFYAFLWQEWVLTFGPKDELFLRPRINELGAFLMPYVNALGNFLTGYTHTDAGVQDCIDVYPADTRCRIQGGADGSHAKWHEQNGNGLLDLMFVCDDMFSVTSKAAKRLGGVSRIQRLRSAVNGRFSNFASSVVKGYEEHVVSVFGHGSK